MYSRYMYVLLLFFWPKCQAGGEEFTLRVMAQLVMSWLIAAGGEGSINIKKMVVQIIELCSKWWMDERTP